MHFVLESALAYPVAIVWKPEMAICEFLHFPSIPVKVTINEYIEISKDYSTIKSGFFINGVLDKLSREYTENKSLQKIGRGLL